ncbi:seryl-tRNA synthetase [Mycoplasmoides fastidiosum]|uniref:Serine--tRNA ligase n=1 Tax=Mycoplasmoides fastidiosum TaxID=92758 RepID=A0ABU0LYP8_9BACT|nr:serine--tRNA ligase [Mycoplasmoides fastidiosum]MDQ0513797.1 seryl-tRNA synthetase [Mycoplasmoides fastidiosum]UUD37785.1 serine--tRNA ligase [Mycoplasmoides fastidiosum]
MIDLRLLKKDFEFVKEKLLQKQVNSSLIKNLKDNYDLLSLLKLEEEKLNNQRTVLSKKIGIAYNQNKQKEALELQKEMQQIKKTLNDLETRLTLVSADFDKISHQIPNLPDEAVPVGVDENDNKVLFQWGQTPKFDFEPQPHWNIASDLDLVDFEAGGKISGSRFVVYKGLGAQLYNALAEFTTKIQVTNNGYYPYAVPVILSGESLFRSGQLPKFEADLFNLGNNKYLSPTSESQLISLYANTIIDSAKLPIKMTATSLCFRKESGAAGRDTRGVIRLHQFTKTELIMICDQKDAAKQLENLTENAQSILKILKLPYQVVDLCTGDLGFSAARTYDLEVWLPSEKRYREISSCSNTGDFQARRALIRHRKTSTDKTAYVALLNGSGVAIDRLFAAILENYQQADGSVLIPEALQPYLNNLKKIEKPKE